MATVEKKILAEYFEAIVSGKKKFEFRLNDFSIAEGDTLLLREWDPTTKTYTGRQIEKKVTYVGNFTLDTFGQAEELLKKGFKILSLE